MQTDINQIKEIAHESRDNETLFSYLAQRKRARGDMDVRRIAKELNIHVVDLGRTLHELEDVGLGRLTFTKRGVPNKFYWNCNLIDVGKLAQGASAKVADIKKRGTPLPRLHDVVSETAPTPVKKTAAVITVRKGNIEMRVPEEDKDELIALLRSM